MPYVSDPNLDEQSSSGSAQAAGQVSGNPNAVSGASGTTSQPSQSTSGNSATQAPAAPSLASGSGVIAPGGQSSGGGKGPGYSAAAPSSSGTWTNLQNYLNANNGGEFGSKFAGNVSNDVNQAQNSLTSASNDFANAVNAGTVSDNQAVDNEVLSSPETMSSADQAAFENQLRGTYTGPQSANSDSAFQSANTQAKNAYDESQQAQNAPGQQALLQKFYNTPTYTSGEQNLDTAILSTDPAAQEALQGLATQAASLPVASQEATAAANAAAAQGSAKTAQTNQEANDVLWGPGGSPSDNPTGGAIGTLWGNVNNEVNNALASYTQQNSDIQNALQTHDLSHLTPSELNELNLGGFSGSIYNVDPTQFYAAANQGDINAGTVASPQEQARMAALMSLAGAPNTLLPNGSVAGTAPSAAFTFNEPAFAAAVQQAHDQYENALTAPNQTISITPNIGGKPMTQTGSIDELLNSLETNKGMNQQQTQAAIARLEALKASLAATYGLSNQFTGLPSGSSTPVADFSSPVRR